MGHSEPSVWSPQQRVPGVSLGSSTSAPPGTEPSPPGITENQIGCFYKETFVIPTTESTTNLVYDARGLLFLLHHFTKELFL
jgi:hypothetical protein